VRSVTMAAVGSSSALGESSNPNPRQRRVRKLHGFVGALRRARADDSVSVRGSKSGAET
jgi:hypothetical protein